MNMKALTLSAATASLLIAASPMVSTSMSTDNGGTKLAIDAYSDGGGVLLINQASDSKLDNSAMNKLVFKYGDAAKSSNTTIKNQVNVLSPGATALEKAAASTTLEVAKVVINPPVNGTTCDDGVSTTSGDVWSNGVCAGPLVDGASCNDNIAMTVGDKYTSGVCAGVYATSCKTIKITMPTSSDGTYMIDPDGPSGATPFNAYCDMTTDGGGWTRLFYQNYSNSKDTTSINLLASGRLSTFTVNQYEERVSSNIELAEVLVAMNTGVELKVKFQTQPSVSNLLKLGVIPSQLVTGGQEIVTSGKNITANTIFNNVPIMFYSSGAVFGEWATTYYVNGAQWWTSNDSANANVRFMNNGVAATALQHYSSILVR